MANCQTNRLKPICHAIHPPLQLHSSRQRLSARCSPSTWCSIDKWKSYRPAKPYPALYPGELRVQKNRRPLFGTVLFATSHYKCPLSRCRRVAEENCSLIEVVEAIRPHLQLTFENILSHINTIYVLQTRQGAMSSRLEQRFLRLKVSLVSVCRYNSLCPTLHALLCNQPHWFQNAVIRTHTSTATAQHNEMNTQNGRLGTAAAIEIQTETVLH